MTNEKIEEIEKSLEKLRPYFTHDIFTTAEVEEAIRTTLNTVREESKREGAEEVRKNLRNILDVYSTHDVQNQDWKSD